MAFEAMKEAAQRLGWKLTPSDPGVLDIYSSVTISGVESGVPVLLDRRAATYVFMTIAFVVPPLSVPFVIGEEGVGGAIANALGMHDVEVGDAAFDKRFRITTKDPDHIKRLLTAEVRTALEAIHERTRLPFHTFGITESAVSIQRTYITNLISADDITADIPLAVAAAKALASAGARA